MLLNFFSHRPLLLLAITAILFFSCSSGSNGQGSAKGADSSTITPVLSYDHSLITGKITDSILCRDQSQNFALYLPTNYSTAKQFPCIFFFDSHGLGALPVSRYKDIAEKYGFVLIGSNASKNGIPWEVANNTVKSLMADVSSRINIDPKRIYTAGFSGGSRVAVTVAIVDGGVAGVLGCAAGFPKKQYDLLNKFDYFGMVGEQDFNLTEMEQWDDALAQNGFAHQLLTSAGMHGWASASDVETAVLWIQVNAMKKQLQPKNDTLVAVLKKDYDKRISAAHSAGEWIKENELLDGMIKLLDGLADVSQSKKQLADLVSGDNYEKAVATQKQLLKTEMDTQQEFVREFTAHDEKWWTKKIAELDQASHTKAKQEAQMNRRLINYLGFIAYANSNQALQTADLTNAASYIRLFKLTDPKNPDCSYLLAIYYMKTGKPIQAIASLNDAVLLGYSDAAQLTTDPAFNSLHINTSFQGVVNKVRGNSMAKQKD